MRGASRFREGICYLQQYRDYVYSSNQYQAEINQTKQEIQNRQNGIILCQGYPSERGDISLLGQATGRTWG